MEVWAAIDLYRRQVVTPFHGEVIKEMVWNENPLDVAVRWESEGADGLHIIDLDAVFGEGSNREIIEEIVKHTRIPVQLGGGIRDYLNIKYWLEKGVERVVLGTLAYRKTPMLSRILNDYGHRRIVVATDYKDGRIVTKGWKESEGLTLLQAIKNFEVMDVQNIIATAVDRDGSGEGPDITTLKEVCVITDMRVIASGGIRNLKDIEELEGIGVCGVILGRALYEGRIKLAETKVGGN
jgi:phosphoribosylformimino-5-aminoimidazole carboxamide ribotide isomerase